MTRSEDPRIEQGGRDRRERFVLHGGAADIPDAVPPAPEPGIDLERALAEHPERRRVRSRR